METYELVHTRFDSDEIRIRSLFRSEEKLAEIKKLSPDITPEKVLDVYGDLCFPPPPPARPYTFGSIVLSSDGKMAFEDDPRGPVIAGANKGDPSGAKADFWALNMLRSFSDAVISGARTLQAEPDSTAHVFCEELAQARLKVMKKRSLHPVNIVLSFDGTDIPPDHKIFRSRGLYTMIATSPAGGAYLEKAAAGKPRRIVNASDVNGIGLWKSLTEEPDTLHIVCTGSGTETDTKALFLLLRAMGIERVCVEAPSYMWHLIQRKYMDEFFINYSMLFAGGGAALGSKFPFGSADHPHAELLTLGIHKENFIFTRQRLLYNL
jgi:riboflavin biosynthesis pyrimidine reductase